MVEREIEGGRGWIEEGRRGVGESRRGIEGGRRGVEGKCMWGSPLGAAGMDDVGAGQLGGGGRCVRVTWYSQPPRPPSGGKMASARCDAAGWNSRGPFC